MKRLDEGLVQVSNEVVGPERYVRISEELIGCKSVSSGCGHSIPVADPVGATDGVGKLRSVVVGEPDEVLHFDVVALNVGARGGRVTAMAGCSSTEDTGIGVRWVVNPDDNTLL